MKRFIVGFVLEILLVGLLIGSVVYATTRDQILMATQVLELQQNIVKQARSNATQIITKVDWLKAQYNDAEKKADIEAGLTQLGIDIAPLITELNTVKSNSQNILDNTTEPKVIK